jgi:hypothetical protein
MTPVLQSYLDHYIGRHRQVAEETESALGEQNAFLFKSLQTDLIELNCQVFEAYPALSTRAESGELQPTMRSLVLLDLQGLLLELDRQHFAFLGGHYAAVGRSLRYAWELIFRALWADTYAEMRPDDSDVPGLTLDEEAAWLEGREKTLNWNSVIEPLLRRLLPAAEHGRITTDVAPLWNRLNRVVHPSNELRARLTNQSLLLVTDSFDADWAAEILSDAATVFDLIWLAVLHRFPDCRGLLANETTFAHCPLSQAAVRA